MRYIKSWEFYDCIKYKDFGDLVTCMLPVCDFWFGRDCDSYIIILLYIGLFQCNGG